MIIPEARLSLKLLLFALIQLIITAIYVVEYDRYSPFLQFVMWVDIVVVIVSLGLIFSLPLPRQPWIYPRTEFDLDDYLNGKVREGKGIISLDIKPIPVPTGERSEIIMSRESIVKRIGEEAVVAIENGYSPINHIAEDAAAIEQMNNVGYVAMTGPDHDRLVAMNVQADNPNIKKGDTTMTTNVDALKQLAKDLNLNEIFLEEGEVGSTHYIDNINDLTRPGFGTDKFGRFFVVFPVFEAMREGHRCNVPRMNFVSVVFKRYTPKPGDVRDDVLVVSDRAMTDERCPGTPTIASGEFTKDMLDAYRKVLVDGEVSEHRVTPWPDEPDNVWTGFPNK